MRAPSFARLLCGGDASDWYPTGRWRRAGPEESLHVDGIEGGLAQPHADHGAQGVTGTAHVGGNRWPGNGGPLISALGPLVAAAC